MCLRIDNEVMPNEESHVHIESELSSVIEILLKTREKLFEATGSNITLILTEQKELYKHKKNTSRMTCKLAL